MCVLVGWSEDWREVGERGGRGGGVGGGKGGGGGGGGGGVWGGGGGSAAALSTESCVFGYNKFYNTFLFTGREQARYRLLQCQPFQRKN